MKKIILLILIVIMATIEVNTAFGAVCDWRQYRKLDNPYAGFNDIQHNFVPYDCASINFTNTLGVNSSVISYSLTGGNVGSIVEPKIIRINSSLNVVMTFNTNAIQLISKNGNLLAEEAINFKGIQQNSNVEGAENFLGNDSTGFYFIGIFNNSANIKLGRIRKNSVNIDLLRNMTINASSTYFNKIRCISYELNGTTNCFFYYNHSLYEIKRDLTIEQKIDFENDFAPDFVPCNYSIPYFSDVTGDGKYDILVALRSTISSPENYCDIIALYNHDLTYRWSTYVARWDIKPRALNGIVDFIVTELDDTITTFKEIVVLVGTSNIEYYSATDYGRNYTSQIRVLNGDDGSIRFSVNDNFDIFTTGAVKVTPALLGLKTYSITDSKSDIDFISIRQRAWNFEAGYYDAVKFIRINGNGDYETGFPIIINSNDVRTRIFQNITSGSINNFYVYGLFNNFSAVQIATPMGIFNTGDMNVRFWNNKIFTANDFLIAGNINNSFNNQIIYVTSSNVTIFNDNYASTNNLPSITGYERNTGDPICVNNNMTIKVSYNDSENDLISTNIYPDIGSSFNTGFSLYSTSPQNTFNNSAIGSFIGRIYITDSSHGEITGLNSILFSYRVASSNCYSTGTGGSFFNITEISVGFDYLSLNISNTFPNEPDGYSSPIVGWSNCANWNNLYAICPFWLTIKEAVGTNVNNFVVGSFLVLILFILIGVLIKFAWR